MVRSLRRKLACSAILLGLAFLLADPLLPPAHADSDYVGVISIDGTIDSVSERFLSRAIDKATGDRARLAVIELDTPGGLLSSTRDMVETILGAEITVAVYVSPQGARAASAGTFITAAARKIGMVGGSLRDVQQLAGHRSLQMTSAYIEGSTDAKRKLVNLI